MLQIVVRGKAITDGHRPSVLSAYLIQYNIILQTAHSRANTGLAFIELSFPSRLQCGVHDRLHIYPQCVVLYFPWHIHQIEGTNGL